MLKILAYPYTLDNSDLVIDEVLVFNDVSSFMSFVHPEDCDEKEINDYMRDVDKFIEKGIVPVGFGVRSALDDKFYYVVTSLNPIKSN